MSPHHSRPEVFFISEPTPGFWAVTYLLVESVKLESTIYHREVATFVCVVKLKVILERLNEIGSR
jgi:hypothetical protein